MGDLLWPNASRSMPHASSEYGMRFHPIDEVWRLHAGIDLVGFSTVCSPVTGTVVYAAYNGGYGNLVIVREDGTGDEHKLAHNRSFLIGRGARVGAGQPVAIMGTTGASTGVHCHHETHPGGGSPINPRAYYANRYAITPSEDDDMTADQYNAMMWELACNRPIKMYHLAEADGSGGWVWVGPTGKAWIVPNPQYAVLADAQKLSQVRPIRSMDRNEFGYLTSQFLPNTNPAALAAEAELDRIVALDEATVAKIVDGIGDNALPVTLNEAQLAAVTAAALKGAEVGGETGAKQAIAGLSFVVATGA